MEINIRLDTADFSDLKALTALVGALGGQLPADGQTTMVKAARDIGAEFAERFPGGKGHDAPGESDGSGEQDGTAGTASTDASGSDRDASGLPWDERIHSGNREKNAGDGLWRKRRGVAQELVDAVTAELRGQGAPAAPAADPTPPASPEPSAPPPPPPPAPADTAPASSAAISADEPAAPPSPPAPASGGRFAKFPDLIHAVQAKDVPAEKKVYAALTPIAVTLGVASFPAMKDHPDLWDMFYEMVGA